jgi:hypothetical protein
MTGKVLICGAGIAGLTLAVLLKEQGYANPRWTGAKPTPPCSPKCSSPRRGRGRGCAALPSG